MDKEIENSIEGYKYLVSFTILIDDKEFPQDNICVCDTRDSAIDAIKKHLEENIELNKQYNNTIAEPYNITRLGCLVKWKSNYNYKWMWEYAILPVKYITD